jgi:hypothetical protein
MGLWGVWGVGLWGVSMVARGACVGGVGVGAWADPSGDGRADRMGPCDILGEQQREVDLALLFVPGQVAFSLVFFSSIV